MTTLPQWYVLCTSQILYWTDPTYRALADLDEALGWYLHGHKWPKKLSTAHHGAFEELHRRERELKADLEDEGIAKA